MFVSVGACSGFYVSIWDLTQRSDCSHIVGHSITNNVQVKCNDKCVLLHTFSFDSKHVGFASSKEYKIKICQELVMVVEFQTQSNVYLYDNSVQKSYVMNFKESITAAEICSIKREFGKWVYYIAVALLNNGSIQVWQISHKGPILFMTLEGNNNLIKKLIWDRKIGRLFSSDGYVIKMWQINTGNNLTVVPLLSNISCFCVKDRILVVSDFDTCKCYFVEDGEYLGAFNFNTDAQAISRIYLDEHRLIIATTHSLLCIRSQIPS